MGWGVNAEFSDRPIILFVVISNDMLLYIYIPLQSPLPNTEYRKHFIHSWSPSSGYLHVWGWDWVDRLFRCFSINTKKHTSALRLLYTSHCLSLIHSPCIPNELWGFRIFWDAMSICCGDKRPILVVSSLYSHGDLLYAKGLFTNCRVAAGLGAVNVQLVEPHWTTPLRIVWKKCVCGYDAIICLYVCQ
jgi:hypothetical protein